MLCQSSSLSVGWRLFFLEEVRLLSFNEVEEEEEAGLAAAAAAVVEEN